MADRKARFKESEVSKDESRFLTADDILGGGEESITPFEVPEIRKGGKPGVLFMRPVSAGQVIMFLGMKGKGEVEQNKAIINLMVDCIVRPDGEPMFTQESAEKLAAVSWPAFSRISNHIMAVFSEAAEAVKIDSSEEVSSTVSDSSSLEPSDDGTSVVS